MTEAGKRLLAAVHGEHAVAPDGIPYWDHVTAIEAEAVAARNAEIAAAVRGLPWTATVRMRAIRAAVLAIVIRG